MNRRIAYSLLLSMSLASLPSIAFAADDEVADAMAKLVDLGPGVHNIQKDKRGRITSCIVVGQARISTTLGKAKGLELARSKANLACSAEFVKWLKEEVTVYQLNEDETVILLEGSEGASDDTLKESAKSVEKSGTKMESLSKGLVRGLQVIHTDTNGEDKTYTVVKGWKADNAEGVKKISANLASDEPESEKKSGKAGPSEKKKGDKEVESGSVTSDAASDFLPKKK